MPLLPDSIPVIDLFAGPGGLGEGFSSLMVPGSGHVFRIGLSIEKDAAAHSTLQLRAFFRQFERGRAPDDYYKLLRGEINAAQLSCLYPAEAAAAANEAWQATLGEVDVAALDTRVRDAIKGAKTWVLIGGPPCQAYSLVGRSRRGGIRRDDHRVFLYREYLRILATHLPPVFVMENVKGLLSSRLGKEGIFERILADLQSPTKALADAPPHRTSNVGYRLYTLVREPRGYDLHGKPEYEPADYVIRAELYGIPQARHRVIILGVRDDLTGTPQPLEERQPVRADAVLRGLPRIRSGLSQETDTPSAWRSRVADVLNKKYAGSWSLAGMEHVRRKMTEIVRSLQLPRAGRGAEFMAGEPDIEYAAARDWFLDPRIGGVCNHSTRGHMATDLHRYLFAACFAQLEYRSPELSEFPGHLLPDHQNIHRAIHDSHFADRFRVQLAERPATTVTSHIAKDGHYYIHYDPSQCRSLTVREAARLQTFPDNYLFLGNRTQQYSQVGNAVPPLLASQIASRVYDLLRQTYRVP